MAVASTGSLNTSPQSRKLLLLVMTMRARSSRTTSRKNRLASKLDSGRVADLVDDQNLWVGELLQAAFEAALLGRPHQPADEFLQGQEQHGVAGFHGLVRQGDGQVGFADTRRAEDDHVARPFHEAHAGEFAHLAPIQAGLELEVELLGPSLHSIKVWHRGCAPCPSASPF